MAEKIDHAATGQGASRLELGWSLGLLALAIGAAYYNSFSGPFVFDDLDSITRNLSIRHFGTAWWPAPGADGTTAAGRPMVNLSLALNYAVGGEAVRSYHVFNLVVHCLSAALLFGLVAATLQQPLLRQRFGSVARPLALAAAVLWGVHPLQTESVTYVVQRAESLMGFFYLLTLYAFTRSVSSERGGFWAAASIGACFAGMATKEVMASIPLMVLLYDRTFVSGTVGAALRHRWRYYVGLAASWVVLLALVLATGARGNTAGFNNEISSWNYALTQCWGIIHYLRLSLWPAPLVFDYGTEVVERIADVWLPASMLAALIAATLWALWRRPAWGFLGAFFFGVLAPSSSFVPIATQTVAEHRMYLPLAAVVMALVTAGYLFVGRRSFVGWVAMAVVFGGLTWSRNRDYQSHIALWADTAAKRPENAFAHFNLAQALQTQQRFAEAVPEYEEAIRLIPDYIEAHTNLGITLQHLGRWPEAEAHYQAALRYDDRPVETLVALGSLLLAQDRWEEAGRVYAKLLEFEPDRIEARAGLAQAFFFLGRLDEARRQFEVVLQLKPGDAAAKAGLEKIAAQAPSRR